MTPALLQKIELLTLNRLELAEVLKLELSENPVLEEAAGAELTLEPTGDEGGSDSDDDPFAEIDVEYFFEEYCRIPVEVEYASEFRYRSPVINEGDILIAISQSGETADTLAAIKEAKKKGAKVLSIVNVVGSSIARSSDAGVYIHAGPEIGVASTKAFTS